MPDEMRRTVICSSMPPLRTRSTVPSNFWRRSRLPSTTRTLTATVSPGRISGISVFCCSEASVFKTSFIGMVIALTKKRSLPEPLPLRLLQPVEDRDVRHAEVRRELADGEAGRAESCHIRGRRRALDAAGRPQPDTGRAKARSHGRRGDTEARRDAIRTDTRAIGL